MVKGAISKIQTEIYIKTECEETTVLALIPEDIYVRCLLKLAC